MSAQDPDDHDAQAVRRSQRSTRRRPSRYLDDDQEDVDVLFPATEETESGSTSSLVESARSDAINAEAVSTRTECSMCSLCKTEMEVNFRKIPENRDFALLAIFTPKLVQIFQIIVDNDLKPVKSVKFSCSLPFCEVLCPKGQ